jgi:hypothetical protein
LGHKEAQKAQSWLNLLCALGASLRLDRDLRRRCFLVLQHVTRVDNGRWIYRDVSFVDVLNDSIFIDHESRTISKALLFVEDTIVFDDSAFEIAEYREGNSNLFCEFAVGGNTVNTHAEDLRVGGFEFGDISLIRLQFLRSTTGERQYVDRKYDVFLPFEIAQLVSFSVGGTQRKLRSLVTDFQMCFRWSWLLGQCDSTKHSKQQEGCE